MLSNGNEDLSCEMSAFLASMELILEMHCCGTVLCEELRQLENCRETTMSGDD